MSAKTRYLRQSPRKVRLVAGIIRGMGVGSALAQLAHVTKAARTPLEKTLRSAIANAEQNFQKRRDHLFIKEICIDEGPDIRRWRPRAFGRAAPILKHSCHISIQLAERLEADVVASDGATSHSHEHASDEHAALPSVDEHKEIFDTARKGRHETAQQANIKEKKSKGFMKKIIQRKAG